MKKAPSIVLSLMLILTFVFSTYRSTQAFTNQRPALKGNEVVLPSISAEESQPCFSLDVVFLIDQSGSMSGQGAPATDPTNQRETGPEAMVEKLSQLALDICPKTYHRIAVISYGAKAQVDVPKDYPSQYFVDIGPETFDDAKALKKKLKDDIIAVNLGQTDHKKAFELALTILKGALPMETGGLRKRVIIFLTDGVPCTQPYCYLGHDEMPVCEYTAELQKWVAENIKFTDSLKNQDTCLAQAKSETIGEVNIENVSEENNLEYHRRVNECYQNNKIEKDEYFNNIYIFTLLLNFEKKTEFEKRRFECMRTNYSQMSTEHGGQLFDITSNRQDIPATFDKIISQLAGATITRLPCGQFAVDPYLKRLYLTFYKLAPELKTRLSYKVGDKEYSIEDGVSTTGGFNAEHSVDGANEHYTFENPQAGVWTLEAPNACQGLEAFFQKIVINPGNYSFNIPSIPQYDDTPYYNPDPEKQVLLTYQMKDEDGSFVEQDENERFKINVKAVVYAQGGTTQNLDMQWHKGVTPDKSYFQATQPLKVPSAGTYRVDLEGTTFVHQGEPSSNAEGPFNTVFALERKLFSHTGSIAPTLDVFSVTKFLLKPLTPIENDVLQPIHGMVSEGLPLLIRSIVIKAQITDIQGNPLDKTDQILTDSITPISAVINQPGKSSTQIKLSRDPQNPTIYAGVIDNYDAVGQQVLSLTLDSGFDVHYRPQDAKVDVQFSRTDGDKTTFVLKPVSPVEDDKLQPIHGTILEGFPLKVKPIVVKVQILKQDGTSLDLLSEVLVDAQKPLTAVVTNKEGKSSKEITLQPETGIPGQYIGVIENYPVEGDQTLTVSLVSDYIDVRYVPEKPSVTISFSRVDGLFNRQITYIAILLGLIALLIVMVFYNIETRNNPVKGVISVRSLDSSIFEFPLNTGKNWAVIPRNVLRNTASQNHDLLSMRVESVPDSKKSIFTKIGKSLKKLSTGPKKKAAIDSLSLGLDGATQPDQSFDVNSMFGYGDTGTQGIVIKGVRRSDKHKFEQRVYPNQPTDIGGQSVAQLFYDDGTGKN